MAMDYSSPSAPSAASLPADPGRDLRVLRLALGVTLVSLVILTGSLGVYLFRQVSMLRRQSEAANRAASQAVQHYKGNLEGPAMQFERNLQEFARANPEFQARIAKYFQAEPTPDASNPPAPATPPTPTPAPAPAPAR